MIKLLIEALKTDNFYGVSYYIDVAKGRYKSPTTWKEMKESIKRNRYGYGTSKLNYILDRIFRERCCS